MPGLARGADGKYTEVIGVNRDPRGVFTVVQIDDALHRHDWVTEDGWIIVAEATELRQLDWEVPTERRWSRAVFIGRNLDEAALKAGFEACVA